jgi:hypothetical protein
MEWLFYFPTKNYIFLSLGDSFDEKTYVGDGVFISFV